MTKCNNCRFRAVIGGEPRTGRIEAKAGCNALLYDGRELLGHLSAEGLVDENNNRIADFEIIPRDPETYKDWQVGDWVHYPNGYDDIVIFRSGKLVVLADDFTDENQVVTAVNTCWELFSARGGRLVLTDIERQIIEEKKKYEPQDGDICYAETLSRNQKFIIIYNHQDWSLEYGVKSGKWRLVEDFSWLYSTIRPATDEEKQQLFDAMAKEGKRWNAEKKVVEDIPKPYEFKKGEPVLVRNHDYELWSLFAYHEQAGDKHIVKTCFHTVLQSQCIPYNERTMHLLGTSEDYKEE